MASYRASHFLIFIGGEGIPRVVGKCGRMSYISLVNLGREVQGNSAMASGWLH